MYQKLYKKIFDSLTILSFSRNYLVYFPYFNHDIASLIHVFCKFENFPSSDQLFVRHFLQFPSQCHQSDVNRRLILDQINVLASQVKIK
jgi:hypothetical protein